MKIKVMTYNLHKGKNLLGRPYNMDSLKIMLSEKSCDIGFFQEVLGSHYFDEQIPPKINSLIEEEWEEHSFAKNSIVNNFEHGNSITSKFPIIDEVKLDLTINRLEKRSALLALIDFGDFKVQCICTHLNLLKSDRIKQTKMLIEFIKNTEIKGVPIILGGDLNDKNGEVTRLLINEAGFTPPRQEHMHPTFPSFLPLLPLDRILCKNIQVSESEIGNPKEYKLYSDHLPLFFDLKVKRK